MNIILVAAALIPAVALMIYIYNKDKLEKEPIGLLIGLFFAGVATCIPAGIIELILSGFLDKLYSGYLFEIDGVLRFASTGKMMSYNFIENFLIIAVVEEGMKWLMMYLFTRKSKHFNCYYDGIVYAVFVSLGFAAFENLFYVLDNGLSNAIVRGLISVPGHMAFAVLMGYYYSAWHINRKAAGFENDLASRGIIQINDPIKPKRFLTASFVFPALAHGAYDFLCRLGTVLSVLIFLAFIVFLYIRCFKRVGQVSKEDERVEVCAIGIISQKYSPQQSNPAYFEYINNIVDPTGSTVPPEEEPSDDDTFDYNNFL